MRRFLNATFIGILWTAILALSLSAQSGPNRPQTAPSTTIPPFAPPAGATITVTTGLDNLTDNGDCTLREAIQAANTDAAVDACPAGIGADLILLAPGSYGLSLEGRSEDANATGDLDIFSSLVISGGGSAETIIDANTIDRVLHILTGTVEIRGVTVQNGRAADGAEDTCGEDGHAGCSGEDGGGIANVGQSRLIDVIVQNNTSGQGFGASLDYMYWKGAGGSGGGIANYSTITIYSSQMLNNRTGGGGGGGGHGGGILNIGVLMSKNVTISGNLTGGHWSIKGPNTSGDGGGIANQGIMTVTNSNIHTNMGNGGGVHNMGQAWFFTSAIGHNTSGSSWWGGAGLFNRGILNMTRCAIFDNVVGEGMGGGGGLRNTGTASLVNCTISGNQSGRGGFYYYSYPGGDGGGILNEGDLLLQYSTIADNQALEGDCAAGICKSPGGSGGGLANDGGAVTIHNSLIAQNGVADGGSGPDCIGIVTSQGPNFIGDPTGCTLGGASDDILNQHAFLGPLMDNPSSGSGQAVATLTHALLPYSHALDAGSCTALDGAPLLTDQRGEPRPQGAGCDLGAFESALFTIPLPEILHLPIIRQQPN